MTDEERDQQPQAPETQPLSQKVPRFFTKRILKLLLGALLAVALCVVALKVLPYFGTTRTERATLSILRSERLAFLALQKVVSQATIEIDENSWFRGKRQGWLTATVTAIYGFDLKKIGPNDLKKSDGSIVVTLPQPALLSFSVDPASMSFITKKSGLNVIIDYAAGKSLEKELRTTFKDKALGDFANKGLIPSRDSLVASMNDSTRAIFQEAGIQVVFQ